MFRVETTGKEDFRDERERPERDQVEREVGSGLRCPDPHRHRVRQRISDSRGVPLFSLFN